MNKRKSPYDLSNAKKPTRIVFIPKNSVMAMGKIKSPYSLGS